MARFTYILGVGENLGSAKSRIRIWYSLREVMLPCLLKRAPCKM